MPLQNTKNTKMVTAALKKANAVAMKASKRLADSLEDHQGRSGSQASHGSSLDRDGVAGGRGTNGA